MFEAELEKDTILVEKEKNSDWRVLWGNGFGKNKEKILELQPVETLYLLYKNELKLYGNGCEISIEEVLDQFSTKENLWKRFLLYHDMKRRGYNLTLTNDRIEIYERGGSPLSSNPTSIMIPISALTVIKLGDLMKEVKRVQNNDLNLILGIVDRDGTITHYKVGKAFTEGTTLKLRQTASS